MCEWFNVIILNHLVKASNSISMYNPFATGNLLSIYTAVFPTVIQDRDRDPLLSKPFVNDISDNLVSEIYHYKSKSYYSCLISIE